MINRILPDKVVELNCKVWPGRCVICGLVWVQKSSNITLKLWDETKTLTLDAEDLWDFNLIIEILVHIWPSCSMGESF